MLKRCEASYLRSAFICLLSYRAATFCYLRLRKLISYRALLSSCIQTPLIARDTETIFAGTNFYNVLVVATSGSRFYALFICLTPNVANCVISCDHATTVVVINLVIYGFSRFAHSLRNSLSTEILRYRSAHRIRNREQFLSFATVVADENISSRCIKCVGAADVSLFISCIVSIRIEHASFT